MFGCKSYYAYLLQFLCKKIVLCNLQLLGLLSICPQVQHRQYMYVCMYVYGLDNGECQCPGNIRTMSVGQNILMVQHEKRLKEWF